MPEHWPDIVELVAPALMAGAGVTLLCGVLSLWTRSRRARRSGRRFCPGPRGRLRSLCAPTWWLKKGRCGYDLTGHGAGGHALGRAVTCPECGRGCASARDLMPHPWQLRFVRPALALIAGSCMVALAHPVIQIRIARELPSPVLIAAEYALGDRAPACVRRPLRWRFKDDELTASQRRAVIPFIVRDMRGDDLGHNARSAYFALRWSGDDVIVPVQRALESDDWQQRQFAASLLRWMDADPPSVALIRVTVEGLQNDGLPYNRSRRASMRINNAKRGVHWLVPHADFAEADLRRGMMVGDAQQQLLCAGALGLAGRTHCLDEAMPILLEHLRDNRIGGDASFARGAIAGFGSAARPYLEDALDGDDRQQRVYVARLLRRVDQERSIRMVWHLFVPLRKGSGNAVVPRYARSVPSVKSNLVVSGAP